MNAVWALLAQRAKVRLAAPFDLVATGFGNLLGTGSGLLFVLTLLARTPSLAGWTRAEVSFVWGFAEAVVGLFYVAFAGLSELNRRYLLGGELDQLLLRPIDPLVALLADNLSLDDLPSVAVGVVVMGAALQSLPAATWLPLLPLWLGFAVVTLGGMTIAFASLGFHLNHRGTTFGLLLHLARYGRWPVDAFPWPIRWGLTLILPLAWTGFYPAALFLGRAEWTPWAWASPLVAGLSFVGGVSAWRIGLAKYTSAGS